jgi:hypothetical protein
MSEKNDKGDIVNKKAVNSSLEPQQCSSPLYISTKKLGDNRGSVKSPTIEGRTPPLKRQPSNGGANGELSIKLQRRNSVQHQDIRRTNKKVSFSPFLGNKSRSSVEEEEEDLIILGGSRDGVENTRYDNVTNSDDNIRLAESPLGSSPRRRFANNDLPPLLTTPSPKKRRPALLKHRSMSTVENPDELALQVKSLDEEQSDARRNFSPPTPLNLHDIISSAPSSPSNIAFAPTEKDDARAEALMRNCKTPTLTSSRGRFAVTAPKTPQDLFFDFVNADLSRPSADELFAQDYSQQTSTVEDEDMKSERKQIEKMRNSMRKPSDASSGSHEDYAANLASYKMGSTPLGSSTTSDEQLDSVEREYEENLDKPSIEVDRGDLSPSFKFQRANSVFVIRNSYHEGGVALQVRQHYNLTHRSTLFPH